MRSQKIKALWPLARKSSGLQGMYKIRMKGWLVWLIPGNIKNIVGEYGINHWLCFWGRFRIAERAYSIGLDYSFRNKWPIRLIYDEVREYTNTKGESTLVGKFMFWKFTGWFTMTPISVQGGIPH